MISDLIFDVGMNRGEDTEHYLSRGFRVVAVEANPQLAKACKERFADPIKSGHLVIESVGIAEKSGILSFYISVVNDEWSAFDKSVACRNGNSCKEVVIRCVTMSELLRKHGVPYYLKIDIERADRHCLESLNFADLPPYVSIEAHELDYLLILWKLGYRQFKVVDQMRHNSRFPNLSNENLGSRLLKRGFSYTDRIRNKLNFVEHRPGSSGPFAEETPGAWLSLEDVAYNWLHFHRGYRNRGNLNPHSWYDFHAKL